MELFDEEVYMHQFKINGKMAFEGDVWQWHQDYGTWLNDDMMPTERAMNVAIFLDDVNEYNGPLMFIPGSHKKGVVEAKHDLTTTSYPLWTVDNDLIRQLVERAGGKNGGIVVAQGPGRLDDPVPQLPGACVDQQPVALEPRQRLPEPVRRVATTSGASSGPSTSRTATSRRSRCLPDDCLLQALPGRRCRGRTACRPARCTTSLEPIDRSTAEA